MVNVKRELKGSIGAGVIVIAGTLSGCAPSHNLSNSASRLANTAKTTNTTNRTGAASGASAASHFANPEQTTTAPSVSTVTPLSAANIRNVEIQSAASVSVNGSNFHPAQLTHGRLEPIVAAVQFQNISVPLAIDVTHLLLNNPSSSAGGGFDYFAYNGQTFKVNHSLPGNFTVRDTIVLRQSATVSFVGTTGTPTPAHSKLQFMYRNSIMGSFPVTNEDAINFNNGSVTVISGSSDASAPPIPATPSMWSSAVKESMQYVIRRTTIPLFAPTSPIYAPASRGTQKMAAQVVVSPTTYNVHLQWANKTLPLNNPALNQPPNTGLADVIGGFGAKVYATPQSAEEQLSIPSRGIDPAYIQPPRNQSGAPVNLGHGIEGTLYASPSDAMVQWHEGEWTLQVTGTGTQSDIQEAEKLVTYLNTALLPETKGVFGVNLTGDGEHTSAKWVFGNVVYTCSDYHSALQAAKMAVSMRTYPG